VTQQDMDWAELVVPFGEDAFLRAREMKAKQLFPVSGADTVLEAIRLGDITHAITDDPFQVGLRTAQMARDYHLESLRNPVNNLDCGEVDAEFLRIYLDKRYELPWTVPQGK
jgi:hypothetical protein